MYPDLGDLSPQALRAYGHRLIDWIADYLSHPERYPVLAQVEPGEIRDQLPPSPPAAAEPMDAIIRDFERIIVPGITHWNHPRFFAYFAITGSVPGILGELLSAALNVNGMLWRTSPAATELEEVTLDWLRQMLGLPAEFRGIIMDTASVASLLAIAAARENLDLGIREDGMATKPRLRLYASEHAHSSIEKGAITLGIGQAGVRKVPTDPEFRMDPHALAAAIREDREAGWLPFCVVATVGTTSTTSIDPVPAIADVCEREGLWLHVDAAYGGMAAIVPEHRHVLAGCDRADSLVTNPHKWLFTPIDCSAFYTRRADLLTRAFSLVPEYLSDVGPAPEALIRRSRDEQSEPPGSGGPRGDRAAEQGSGAKPSAPEPGRGPTAQSAGDSGRPSRALGPPQRALSGAGAPPTNYMDWGIQLGRRFRALKLWMIIRAFGSDGLAARLREHIRLGRLFADWVDADPEFERLAPVPFSTVCFRARPSDWDSEALDALNEQLLAAVNATGEAFLSHTKLHGAYTLRLAIGNIRTTEADVARTWELLRTTARELSQGSAGAR